MTDSIRQQIIGKLDTRLKTIKKTANYKTDAGLHVFDWLDRDLADSELDAIIYRDRTTEINHGLMVSYINKVRVEIEMKTKASTGTAARLRQMLEDVCAAINVDETWGGLAENTEPLENSMDIQQQDKIVGSATLTIEIEYTTNKWSF